MPPASIGLWGYGSVVKDIKMSGEHESDMS
jgi:hypothetical protein